MFLTFVHPDLIMFNELTASCVISHETRKDQMYVKLLNGEIFEALRKSLVNHRALDHHSR